MPETVWDYPRPPRLDASPRHIQVILNGRTIADSRNTMRVLETSHPPVHYVPQGDVVMGCLRPVSGRRSFCEWKGMATYWSVTVGDRVEAAAAWSYPDPTPPFAAIAGWIAFYPGRMDACFVDGERVTPQPGDFYGGWITADIIGPFKGGPGTSGW